MNPGDIVRFVRNPPANSHDTGIWVYEYGLVLTIDKRKELISVLCGKDVITTSSMWCSLADDKNKDFIDELAERFIKSEVGT